MDRVTLIAAGFIAVLMALNGGLTTPSITARKGYSPRLGLALGVAVGMLGAALGAALAGAAIGASPGASALGSLLGGLGALAALWNRLPDRDVQRTTLPEGSALRRTLAARHLRGTIARLLYRASIALALIALATLLWTIADKSFGLVAVQYDVEPDALLLDGAPTGRPLEDLSESELEQVLAQNVREALLRRFILENVLSAPQTAWPELSPALVSDALAEYTYPAELADRPLNELSSAEAARLINADLGLRVLTVAHGSFDLHDGHAYGYPRLLEALDAGIEAFFTTLASRFRDRVALATFSEFGRTVRANGSGGTDHGTAAPQLVIGHNVRGGLYGTQPRLDDLSSRGDLKVHVDHRSYYASIVDGWLGGGSRTVLGGSYEDLGLFRATPGGGSTPGEPPPNPWRPFPDAPTLVRQQYLDLLGRVADETGVSYWSRQLTSGRRSISWVVASFVASPEFGVSVAPAARLAFACLGGPPAFDDLMDWAGRVRRGETLESVAARVCARPAFATRFGALADRAFVAAAYRAATGRAISSASAAYWTGRLGRTEVTRPDFMAAAVATPGAQAHLRPSVDVTMTYAGLLRRTPETAGLDFWVDRVSRGQSLQVLVAQFFASAEYRARFA